LIPGDATSHYIAANIEKPLHIETLLPASVERFPWAGHLGLKLLPQVIARLRQARSTLIFTNTRAQTELWFQALVDDMPEYAGEIALHHGSLDPELRSEIETRLADGRLRCVVCTSSLDLGVDFAPVDQVIQVGSPKGIARFLQRAGRSGHSPHQSSTILCVPTHAFELIEFAAVRTAVASDVLEARIPLRAPLDVLVQHLVTCALGGGFELQPMRDEVRSTYAYKDLTTQEWEWALDFVSRGGAALQQYPEYARVTQEDNRYVVTPHRTAQFHRMSIGTITSDSMLQVKYLKGSVLGSVEESFISRLRPGDAFIFAGRTLELVQVKDMTAFVRLAGKHQATVPRWMGGRMPLSSQLAASVRRQLSEAIAGHYTTPELRAVRPLLELQNTWSHIPAPGELLIESIKSRDGNHLFIYPLAGRMVHEGLGALLAYRLTQLSPRSVSLFYTDYGIEFRSPQPLEIDELGWRSLFTTERLRDDIFACLNTTELARRQFRDIARIAGLIFSGYPGSRKTTRQIQTSSALLFDLFAGYDPENLLLDQARREVHDQQLDLQQLQMKLEELHTQTLVLVHCRRLTPFSFPIWADRVRTQVSSEVWSERIQRLRLQLESDAP
jgi:ATP-dependent helicase Lhr and Lhr-like helicase